MLSPAEVLGQEAQPQAGEQQGLRWSHLQSALGLQPEQPRRRLLSCSPPALGEQLWVGRIHIRRGSGRRPPSSSLAPAKPPAAGGAARAATRPLAPLLTPGDAARADFLPCLHARADLADAASQAGTRAL